MIDAGKSFFGVPRASQALLRELGLTRLEQFFTDPRIIPWRSIPERENCTLDAVLADGRSIRLHIKRHKAAREAKPPGEQEADGILILQHAKIPTMALVAWGKLEDGRSFIATEDLAGYRAADKLIESGVAFERLLEPTADLAAKLHDANLHHRDLYLCHFFARIDGGVDLKLIDVARVRRLPWLFPQRWIVKDLAQFWHSATRLSIPESKLDPWLRRYAQQRKVKDVQGLKRSIVKKASWIARHDAKLQVRQPNRNISLPEDKRR
jgi:hypothetical protein